LRGAVLLHAGFLLARWVNLGRVPLVGHYEFGNFLIWVLALMYLRAERRHPMGYRAIGATVSLVLAALIAYVTLFPMVSSAHRPLPPVLRYPLWLNIHVTASALGYAGFSLAAAVAVLLLVRGRLVSNGATGGRPAFPPAVLDFIPDGPALEQYMHEAATLGFLWQTVMIISGGIWADAAWGRYWGWDPKEMWSLVTWVVFAAYLHARLTRGWRGPSAAYLVILGWAVMIFTWLGVAYLLPGIHSFG
jgi:cytochrome c-type biogenesis protein CcsB